VISRFRQALPDTLENLLGVGCLHLLSERSAGEEALRCRIRSHAAAPKDIAGMDGERQRRSWYRSRAKTILG
jgi:hypothetical protein